MGLLATPIPNRIMLGKRTKPGKSPSLFAIHKPRIALATYVAKTKAIKLKSPKRLINMRLLCTTATNHTGSRKDSTRTQPSIFDNRELCQIGREFHQLGPHTWLHRPGDSTSERRSSVCSHCSNSGNIRRIACQKYQACHKGLEYPTRVCMASFATPRRHHI